MLIISSATLVLSVITLAFVVAVGWLLLTVFANKPGMRIARPLLTMLQVAGVSSIVFMLASVPSYVGREHEQNHVALSRPFAAVLLAVSFIAVILKLESKAGGLTQAAIALGYAVALSGALTLVRFVLPSVFVGVGL